MKIAIASGKGGTGKTLISTNIFYSLLLNHYRPLLVDCDAEAPNAIAFFETILEKTIEITQQVPVIDTTICTFCGKCHEYCNYNAIFFLPYMKIIQVAEELCHGCGACSVACGYGAITEKPVSLGQVSLYTLNGIPSLVEARMNIGGMTPVPLIKGALKQIHSDTEITILDSPPGTSCPFITTVSAADYVILVTEPTPFGLSDLKQSVDTLKQLDKPCGVIINRAGLGNKSVHQYLEQENIPLLLEIPFDKRIAETYARGQLVIETQPLLGEQLYMTVKTIMEQHGNSSHQR